jgi:hypothetical protein
MHAAELGASEMHAFRFAQLRFAPSEERAFRVRVLEVRTAELCASRSASPVGVAVSLKAAQAAQYVHDLGSRSSHKLRPMRAVMPPIRSISTVILISYLTVRARRRETRDGNS